MLNCAMTVTYWAIFFHSCVLFNPAFYCVPFLFRAAVGQKKKKKDFEGNLLTEDQLHALSTLVHPAS